MTVMRKLGLGLLAIGLVALSVSDAAAQAPTLTVSATGATVTIQWTAVPGATGYTLLAGTQSGVANVATVTLPPTTTSLVVTAPAGTYYLALRGTAGTVQGPLSAEVSVTVGAPPPPPVPCTGPPTPPTIATAVDGVTVTVSWNAIAGASSYSLQFTRVPGSTELVVNVPGTQTSATQYVSLVGTFYVRVVVLTGCGNATSAESAFAVSGASGSGPRAPNPPPGQLLPIPSYGAAVVADMGRRFPGDAARARPSECPGGSNTFLFRVLQALRQQDSRWGLNYKRGNFPTLSEDIITYNGTDGPDEGASRIHVIDIVGGDCLVGVTTFADKSSETWANRGQPYCGTEWCARWTLAPYIGAGFPASPQ